MVHHNLKDFDGRSTGLHLLLIVVCLVLFSPRPAFAVQDAENCEDALEAAEELYLDGEFSETITMLSDCYYRDDLDPELSIEVARLVALSHMNMDDLDAARRSVLRILSFDPTYQADPVQDPPSYASMVNIVRRQVQAGELDVPAVAEESRSRNWIYVVGGAVLTGAVTAAVVLMTGGDGDAGGDVLPGPPGTPTQ